MNALLYYLIYLLGFNLQGITQEHLDMLGPIICQTIRPLVFKAGLWTIEVEKSWTHLFDMVATLMKVLHISITIYQTLQCSCFQG